MRLVTFIAAAILAATLLGGSGSGIAAPDPQSCTGYPEPRIFLENQSWWEPQAQDPADPGHPGTGKQGHIHIGTCFPLYQTLHGDSVHFDINVKLHNMTGYAYQLRIDGYGDYHYDVPRQVWSGDAGKPWHCATADCEQWVSADFPLSALHYTGDHEWNIFMIVWKSDFSIKQYNVSRWHASVDNGLPAAPVGSTTWATQQGIWIGTGGDTWYPTGVGKYGRVGMVREDIPWDESTGKPKVVKGTWSPRLNFEKPGKFVYVDPALHANPPSKGTVILETTDSSNYDHRAVPIDTTQLTDGWHKLVFGTFTTSEAGTNTGVGVIKFYVDNVCNESAPS
jgi:hypothetical protein